MKKIAILIAHGFEEGETFAVLDVLRRAGMQCDLVSVEGQMVCSTNGVSVQADHTMHDGIRLMDYDMLVVPGGAPHTAILSDNGEVLKLIRTFDSDPEKFVVAICSGPVVLAKSGILKGRRMTSYPGPKSEPLFTDADYCTDIVVVDNKLITSRGPVSGFTLGYTLIDLLGGDGDYWRERMLYNQLRKSNF